MHYLISLGLTVLLELPLALVFRLSGRDLALVAVANLLTNPLVVLTHTLLPDAGPLLQTVLPELWAVATEAVIYEKLGRSIPHPLGLSVAANAFSYTTGLLLQQL